MMVNADGVDDFPFTDPCPHHHLFYIHAYPSFHITPYPWFFFVCQTAIPKGAPNPTAMKVQYLTAKYFVNGLKGMLFRGPSG